MSHGGLKTISREAKICYNGIIIIPLTQKQQEIIVGNLLGDGGIYLSPNLKRKTSTYCFKQSKEHKEYVLWIYNELINICPSFPKQRKDTKQWQFISRRLENLNSLQNMFYKDKKKIIPKNIEELLISPLSLAIWYMDDGTLDYRPKNHYAYRLATNCFSVPECFLLIKALKNNFDIDASVQTTLIRGKRYPRIYIGEKGRDRFYSLIKPYILKCFSSKLPPLAYF